MVKPVLNRSLKSFFSYRRFNALWRGTLLYVLSDVVPQIVVTEYPKSGGSWFCQMLSKCLGLPFPRNELPGLRTNIMQGHYLPSKRFKSVFCVVRDGRDVMVSSYFYYMFQNEKYNSPIVKRYRSALQFADYNNIAANLPKFVEFQLTAPLYPRFSWPRFVDAWKFENVCFVKYEDLLSRPVDTMLRVARAHNELLCESDIRKIVEKYSFKTQSGRNSGDENINSFLRKGISGDWRNYFSKDAKKTFNELAGRQLIDLGYERDDNWVC